MGDKLCVKSAPNCEVGPIIREVQRMNIRRFVLLVLSTLCLGPSFAAASPGDVLRDFRADQHLDRSYPVADMLGALDRVEGARYRALLAAVNSSIYSNVLGVQPADAGRATPVPKPAPKTSASPPRIQNEVPGPGLVPSGSLARPAAGLPFYISTLGAMAVILALGGLASAVVRRQPHS